MDGAHTLASMKACVKWVETVRCNVLGEDEWMGNGRQGRGGREMKRILVGEEREREVERSIEKERENFENENDGYAVWVLLFNCGHEKPYNDLIRTLVKSKVPCLFFSVFLKSSLINYLLSHCQSISIYLSNITHSLSFLVCCIQK